MPQSPVPTVHAFVLAGGAGARLHPLTRDCCKPALPFGSSVRIVDFVLGNLLNSGVVQVDLLVQYRPQMLVAHVLEVWAARFAAAGGHLAVHGPRDPSGFRGTADAVRQQLARLRATRPGLVAVFGADHVYRMDVRQMIDAHRAHGADATVATLPVPLAEANGFGIVDVEADGRARRFDEKPAQPRAMPGRPGHALASMGNYVFDTALLHAVLARCAAAGEHDFGHHVLPRLIGTHRVFAYDFAGNRVPGALPCEEQPYWRDVGTLEAYFAAHLDVLGPQPRFNLDNPQWPIAPRLERGRPPALRGEITRSCIGADAVVDGARLDQVVVGRGARIGAGAWLERCIVLDGAAVGPGARLRDVIVEAGAAVAAGQTLLAAGGARGRPVVIGHTGTAVAA